jgi:regulatory protein
VVKTYEKALKFLKIRPHHSAELTRKLSMRGFDRAEISDAINQLKGEGLLNDKQFAEMYLESLLKYKTFGYYGLKAKLLSRGVASKDADNLLTKNLLVEQEYQIAQKLVNKSRGLDKIRLSQRLSRKGFRSEVISQIINLEFER